MSTASFGDSDQLFFNGIDGTTGSYLLPPLSVADLAGLVRGTKYDQNLLRSLKIKGESVDEAVFAPMPGFSASDLSEVGWGIILPAVANASRPDPRLDALRELLDWRREQASRKNPIFYQEFTGPRGFRPDDTVDSFMRRLKVDYTQPVDPQLGVPFYLLLVASPDEIPYSVQYQLDVQFAVGRIHFDALDEYSQYARSVVRAERREVRVTRSAVFFGVQNHDDPATQLSASQLVAPLTDRLRQDFSGGSGPAWNFENVLAEQATKSNLADHLGGSKTPALLFTASHGMGFPKGDSRQLPHQGALLCQDWPGPRVWQGPIDPNHYLAASDIADNASLAGMIAFHFACYGAGTPEVDDFAHGTAAGRAGRRPSIAMHPFVAALPKRLLSHPRGGALAVIGHVERAWGYSFQSPQIGSQIGKFVATLTQLMQGLPVGLATDYFNIQYATMATSLAKRLEDQLYGQEISDRELAALWTSHNDARSYIVLGDPAVRLPLINANETPARPATSVATITNPTSVGLGLGDSPAARFSTTTNTSAASETASRSTGSTAANVLPNSAAGAYESDPFLQQIELASQRYDQSKTEGVSFEIGSSDRTSTRAKDAARLRWRLLQLGIPVDQIPALYEEGIPFRPITLGESDASLSSDLLLERIMGRNDLVAAPRFLEAGLMASRAVARIRIQSPSGSHIGWGTGSLIAPRLLLTNNHVLKTAALASGSVAEFNVEEPLPGQMLPTVPFSLRPDEFFITDAALDFTLVAVAPQSSNGRSIDDFGFNRPFAGDDPILESERVNIIQHPNGRPKELSLRDNTVTAIQPDFIQYQADTEPGSSGSPVFNDQWQLVALHHSGVPKRDSQGRILMRDGTLWQKGMNEQMIDWIANEGVRLSRILAKVHAAPVTTPIAKTLRDQLRPVNTFEATNPSAVSPATTTPLHTVDPGSLGPIPPSALQAAVAPTVASATAAGGVIKIVLPVEITLSLGQIDQTGAVNVQMGSRPQGD